MGGYEHKVIAATAGCSSGDNNRNGTWCFADVDGNGTLDLTFIQNSNTQSKKVEVHAFAHQSGFQWEFENDNSGFEAEDNGTWLMRDWTGDGFPDLIYIKTRNTGTGKVEIHIADGAPHYGKIVAHIATGFNCEADNGTWTMSKNGEYLVYIKHRNTNPQNKVELHAVSRASNYQTFTHHMITDFDCEDNGTWCLSPRPSEGLKYNAEIGDLYYIKTRNTGSNKIEVHAVSSDSNWKTRLIPYSSGIDLQPEGEGLWTMVDFGYEKSPDLAWIKIRNTASYLVEVRVVECANNGARLHLYKFMNALREF